MNQPSAADLTGEERFVGVTLDFSRELGPVPGRYVVARPGSARPLAALAAGAVADRGADVLVISQVGAPLLPERRLPLRRRARPVRGDDEADPVWLTRITYLRGDHVSRDQRSARDALDTIRGDRDLQEELVAAAVLVTNTAIRAHRVAVGDPTLPEIGVAVARRIRIGAGSADEVARGRFADAIALTTPDAAGWHSSMPPAEALSAVLGGRVPLLDADELILRVAGDLGARRTRLAALGLPTAIELLLEEVPQDEAVADLRARVAALQTDAAALALRTLDGVPCQAEELQWLADAVRSLWDLSSRARRLFDPDEDLSALSAPTGAPLE
jgi:hypothetical protein